jgi:hypothetical protein
MFCDTLIFRGNPARKKIASNKRRVQRSLFLGYGCLVVLEISIGPVRSIYSSYKACISAGIRVGGVVVRLHHGSSLVGSFHIYDLWFALRLHLFICQNAVVLFHYVIADPITSVYRWKTVGG